MCSRPTLYQSYLKPLLDRILATAALISCCPILVVIAAAVRIKLGSPILFTQMRPGRNGHVFHLYKFRTMTTEPDATGRLLPDAERLTPFGRWLRSTSLDELPEFWNVLRGDMSIVGPRPLLMEYLDRYTPEQARRHEVLPGITGWAQVQARNATTWTERFQQDGWYVDNVSVRLDMYILWRTVITVITRRGISATDHATMPRFYETSTPGATHGRAA